MQCRSKLLETVRDSDLLYHRDQSLIVKFFDAIGRFRKGEESPDEGMLRARLAGSRGLASGEKPSEAVSTLEESEPILDVSPPTTSQDDDLKNCNKNPRICGKEAACRSFDSKTSKCVCPHDLSPPTKDLKCPNRLLAPVTPRPIHNIIPPTGNATNGTTAVPDVEQVEAVWRDDTSETIGITTACLTVFAVLSILIYIGRGKCNSSESRRCTPNGSPRSLKNGPLLANKYTPNLQYFGCAPPDVPVLHRDTIIFIRDIGEGCFGRVFKGEIRVNDGRTEIVAVKVLKDSASREAEEDFAREVEIMSTFRHENILSLLGVVARDPANGPWMVFEYMPYGDLAGVLRASGKKLSDEKNATSGLHQPLTESCLDWITLQIAAGMNYLSCQRFVHRDLACRNCLVGTNLVVKIADFGMSRDVYTCDYYKIGGSRLLPVRWMSPESVMYGRFTLESDVWSFGVVLWEIYSYGKQPYYGRNNEEVVKLIVAGVTLLPPDDSPPLVSEMMRDCWRSEPRDRPRFVEILEKLERNNRERENTKETLPRPPQGPITVRSRDVLDTEGYLLPAPALPIEYLQTLAD